MKASDPVLLSRAARCADRWRLRLAEPLRGGAKALVVSAVDAEGRPCVLKLLPLDQVPQNEAAALRSCDGHGAVRLWEFDPELGALLMEQVIPGTPLSGPDADRVDVAATVLATLRLGVRPSVVPTVLQALAGVGPSDWGYGAPISDRGETVGWRLIDHAFATARHLEDTAAAKVLLHGDFQDKNLIAGPNGYVAIDPQPMVGDPCADIGFFAAAGPRVEAMLAIAGAVATRLNLDVSRAERWTAVWAVGIARWTWPPNKPLAAWVAGRNARRLLGA